MSYILFTTIESDNNIGHLSQWHNSQHHKISYEEEAISCFTAWRTVKHALKDIQIICINPTYIDISEPTKEKFKELNIDYRFEPNDICETFKCRWYVVPYLGMLLEEKLNKNDILIHIDLDMLLMIPLNKKHLKLDKNETIVGAYDEDNFMDKREYAIYEKMYEQINVTCYIVSQVDTHFYETWWKILKKESDKIDQENNWREYCDMEEHSVDILKYEQNTNIKYIDHFMLGPGYSSFETTSFQDIKFIHAHKFQERDKLIKEYVTKKLSL